MVGKKRRKRERAEEKGKAFRLVALLDPKGEVGHDGGRNWWCLIGPSEAGRRIQKLGGCMYTAGRCLGNGLL